MSLDVASYTTQPNTPYQFTTDFTLTGEFEISGMLTKLALGADYGRYVAKTHGGYSVFDKIVVDIRDYNPSLPPDPRFTDAWFTSRRDARWVSESLGAFFATKIYLTDPLSVTVGARAGMERRRGSFVFTHTDGSKSFGDSGVPWSSVVVTP